MNMLFEDTAEDSRSPIRGGEGEMYIHWPDTRRQRKQTEREQPKYKQGFMV